MHVFIKISKTLFVLVATVLILVGAAVLYIVKFKDNSFYGGEVKDVFIRNPWFVRIFNLDKPGDAKYIYMDNNYSYINIYIYYTADYQPPKKLDDWLEEMVGDTLEKNVVVNKAEIDNELVWESYDDNRLKKLKNSVEDKKERTPLNLFYLSEYQPYPQYLGLTLDRDSIFIFQKSFNALREEGEVLDRLERSTTMHEWGHLLGLGHIGQQDCVMSETVHFYSDRALWSGEVPVEYCAETFYQLKQLQKTAEW